jgi:hypothetical protein
MLPEMGRQLDEKLLELRSHFKTDLFGDLFLREFVSQKSGSRESLRRIVRRQSTHQSAENDDLRGLGEQQEPDLLRLLG